MGHIIMSAAADQGPLLNRVSMATYTIAVVLVLLRSVTPLVGSMIMILTPYQLLHTRFRRKEIWTRRPLHIHCYCMLWPFGVALNQLIKPQTLGLAQTATIILQVEHGRGRHAIDLHIEDFNLMLMVSARWKHVCTRV